MSNNEKLVNELKIEMQVAVDEFNTIQEKINDLALARNALRMKAISCDEKIKKLKGKQKAVN